jgi:hydrogen peroxide-dependent heme synthase
MTDIVETPQTLDGHFVLHDCYTVLWPAWSALSVTERDAIATQAAEWLRDEAGVGETYSALYSMMGHKSDIMLIHYRSKIDALNRTERGWKRLRLAQYLRSTYSYFSVIEASLYEAVAIAQRKVTTKGLAADSKEYQEAFEKELAKEKKVLEGRVLRTIPDQRYVCFYPMNKRRGEQVNWYNLSTEERRQMMRGHGKVGHKYAREVTQVIGGSIGFDDYEWGVSLHSNDPLAVKRLITEMRFDPASSLYAEFGPFYFGIRQQPDDLPLLLSGGLS